MTTRFCLQLRWAASENGFGRIRIRVFLQDIPGPAGGRSSLNREVISCPAIPVSVRLRCTYYIQYEVTYRIEPCRTVRAIYAETQRSPQLNCRDIWRTV